MSHADLIDDNRDDELELYALDLLDRDAAAAVEQRLRDDPVARERVRELRGTAAALALDLEPAVPSPQLRARILDAAHAELSAAPARPVVLDERRRATRAWLPWAVAAALALLLVASLVWNARLRDQVDQRTPAVAHAVTTDSTAVGVTGTVLELGDTGTLLLSLSGLPTPDAGHVYQVWLIADGVPNPSVTFQPGTTGDASVAVQGDANRYEVLAVTLEPNGGSLTPSAPPIIFSDLTRSGS